MPNYVSTKWHTAVETSSFFLPEKKLHSYNPTVKLKSETYLDPSLPHPRPYHQRLGHSFHQEDSPMTEYLSELQTFADLNQMSINHDKTKLMIFNKSITIDFLPNFKFGEHEIEVIEKTKLLGLIITTDLKWEENTTYICQKAMARLWLLRRMKKLQLDPVTIHEYYVKEIRPLLELATPAWHSVLTKAQSDSIEWVQKTALCVILGDKYLCYDAACSLMSTETLKLRRDALCLNFAKKTASKSRHKDLFSPILQPVGRRQEILGTQLPPWQVLYVPPALSDKTT